MGWGEAVEAWILRLKGPNSSWNSALGELEEVRAEAPGKCKFCSFAGFFVPKKRLLGRGKMEGRYRKEGKFGRKMFFLVPEREKIVHKKMA